MTRIGRSIAAAALAGAVFACGANREDVLDPDVLYDVYGRPFEPAVAQQVPAVLAETELYLDGPVMIEGLLHDECRGEDCWSVLKHDSVGIEIVASDFSVPDTVRGRRAVVHGQLSRVDSTLFRLLATGVLIEKART